MNMTIKMLAAIAATLIVTSTNAGVTDVVDLGGGTITNSPSEFAAYKDKIIQNGTINLTGNPGDATAGTYTIGQGSVINLAGSPSFNGNWDFNIVNGGVFHQTLTGSSNNGRFLMPFIWGNCTFMLDNGTFLTDDGSNSNNAESMNLGVIWINQSAANGKDISVKAVVQNGSILSVPNGQFRISGARKTGSYKPNTLKVDFAVTNSTILVGKEIKIGVSNSGWLKDTASSYVKVIFGPGADITCKQLYAYANPSPSVILDGATLHWAEGGNSFIGHNSALGDIYSIGRFGLTVDIPSDKSLTCDQNASSLKGVGGITKIGEGAITWNQVSSNGSQGMNFTGPLVVSNGTWTSSLGYAASAFRADGGMLALSGALSAANVSLAATGGGTLTLANATLVDVSPDMELASGGKTDYFTRDGKVDAYTLGALTVGGGAVLTLDADATGCDTINAASTNITATAENKATIELILPDAGVPIGTSYTLFETAMGNEFSINVLQGGVLVPCVTKVENGHIVVTIGVVTLGTQCAIVNVSARQRYPWNGKVDVSFEVVGDVLAAVPAGEHPYLSLSALDYFSGSNYVAIASAISGDTGVTPGVHNVVWDLNAQGLEFKSDAVVFTVAYVTLPPLYCVVDLSAGANASAYPVTYMDSPPSGGFNTDEYKTTRLVMRRIESGSFVMGSVQTDATHRVTLTKPFYVGIFELTQNQYQQVTGSNPSHWNLGDGWGVFPVEQVSYNAIRGSLNGAEWPRSSAVDTGSFIGKLRARTGLSLDLPTEAQWEYACRAGTTSYYNNGGDTEADLRELGQYWWDYHHSTAPVGTYTANAWGLYDMHGNVNELCLDFYDRLLYGGDPIGAQVGPNRVMRGGGWCDSWGTGTPCCSSSYRSSTDPSSENIDTGFRIARTLHAAGVCVGSSLTIFIDSRTGLDNRRADYVSWNASWIGGDPDATAVIEDNGVEVARSSGIGSVALSIGRHDLRCSTLVNNVAQKEVYAATVYKCNCDCALGDVPLVETKAEQMATCEEDGWTHEVKCGRCNTILEMSTTLPGGHARVETKAAKSASCTEDGWTHEVKCSRCNDVLEVSTSIPALGHIEVISKPAVEPTDLTQGMTAEISCSRCGKVLQAQKVIPAVIRNVTAKQRYPWNGLVDITCNVSGIHGASNGLKFVVEAVDMDSGIVNKASHLWVVRNGVNSTDLEVCANGEYRLLWDAQSDLGQVRYTNVVIRIVVKNHYKIQLWENGPYWADSNIGADEPWEYGYYFQWGDSVGNKRENDVWVKSDDSSSGFSLESTWPITCNKTISMLQSEGVITSDEVLAPRFDAAHVHWGDGWRMPTEQELADLNSKCDWFWTTMNDVTGYVVRGRGDHASASIFLPAAGNGDGYWLYDAGSRGCYWSSVPGSGYMDTCEIRFISSRHFCSSGRRNEAYPIRPVQGASTSGQTSTVIQAAIDSAPIVIDTVMASPGVDSVPWNAAWVGGDSNAIVVITDNGIEVDSTTGVGEFALRDIGRHDLAYTTYIDGVEQDEVYRATVYKCNCSPKQGDVTFVCTEDGGRHEAKCGRCNAVLEVWSPSTEIGHFFIETKTAKAATCTAYGWTHEVICSLCNTIVEPSMPISAGHLVYETKAGRPATCTEDGWTREMKCRRCNAVVETSTAIPALGHRATETKEAKSATCTEDGWTHEVRCSRCNEVVEESTAISALGGAHEWSAMAAIEPTCVVDGRTAGHMCSRCGATQESEVILALGHVGAITKPPVEPTSSRSGLTAEITCTRCGEVLQGQTTIPALGYIRNVKARQLWPHKKVEVCYEVAEDVDDISESAVIPTVTCKYGKTIKTAKTSCKYGDATCAPGIHRVVWDFEAQSIAINQSSVPFTVSSLTASGISDAIAVNTSSSVYDGMTLNGKIDLGYSPFADGEAKVVIDDEVLLSSTNSGVFAWQPQTAGPHTIKHISGDYEWTRTVVVNSLLWPLLPEPYPPTAADENISIGTTTKAFAANGGSGTITTSGSGTWTATASDTWITIPSSMASRNAGLPVVYQVKANTDVASRTGYVYVSGHVFTITQAGVGANLDRLSADFEMDGGSGSFTVLAGVQAEWDVRSNVDWISVTTDGDGAIATHGTGEAMVYYTIAPFNEISTRSGTITAAGCTFTVNQTGRRMTISGSNITPSVSGLTSSFDYLSHVLAVQVNAFASTEWEVVPGSSWISIVDSGSGHGGGSATIAINENPSWLARSGTVRIGTETLTIKQSGRPAGTLDFAISPESSAASVKGANGLISVTATPDLPWTAQSQANWLTVMPALQNGAGNGNVVYSVSPNSTMADRSGTICISAISSASLPGKTHTVSQPAAVVTISTTNYVFDAAGESFDVEVTADDIVNWSISENVDWISVVGDLNRIGPGTVTLAATGNSTIDPREASLTIAGHTFAVRQMGRAVAVEYETRVFGAAADYSTLDVHPDGNVQWMAVASDPTWLTIWGDDGCEYDDDGNVIATGDHTIEYIVSDYTGDGTPRTATITIGDKTVYITQRPYDLSISPSSAVVSGNAGAGEIGVSATVGQIWTAIATEPWISIVTGYDSGTGSGRVLFAYTDNNTGKTRTGKVIISGEAYTITQAARQMAAVTARIEGGKGVVNGTGTYDRGTVITLSAVANDGYEFMNWGLPDGSTATGSSLALTADTDKEIVANFRHIPVYIVNGESVREGTSRTFTAPADVIDENGTRKLVCRGTSRYPDKGTSFTLVVSEDIDFEWDLWTTNYLVSVEQSPGGAIRAGGSQSPASAIWVESGATIDLTAVPDSGKSFFRWNISLTSQNSGNPLNSFENASANSASLCLCVSKSTTVSAVFGTFNDTLATALDAPALTFTTGGDANWLPVVDTTAQTGYTSARSGAIGAESETWFDTMVEGPGTLSFRWRVDCERDDGGGATWDRLAVFTNGVEAARIDGQTGWQTVTVPVYGKTTIRWSFYRDDWDEPGETHENAAWVDSIEWKEGR